MNEKTVTEMLAEAREAYAVFGKYIKALSLVDSVLELEQDNIEVLNLKASILYELDRETEAAEYHLRAHEREPNSVEALHGLAAVANDQELDQQALDWLEKAFAAIPNDPYPEFRENEDYRQRVIAALFNERAFALWFSGKKPEAIALLTETAPKACPMEVEDFEDEIEWLTNHPDSPDE